MPHRLGGSAAPASGWLQRWRILVRPNSDPLALGRLRRSSCLVPTVPCGEEPPAVPGSRHGWRQPHSVRLAATTAGRAGGQRPLAPSISAGFGVVGSKRGSGGKPPAPAAVRPPRSVASPNRDRRIPYQLRSIVPTRRALGRKKRGFGKPVGSGKKAVFWGPLSRRPGGSSR